MRVADSTIEARAQPMSDSSQRREQVREMLRLLASEEEQLAYEGNVPHVDITAELLCMWFDDLYHGKAPSVDSAFDGAELAAISEFHRLYDQCSRGLPESRGTVRSWLDDPGWREIMEEARMTLERIAE